MAEAAAAPAEEPKASCCGCCRRAPAGDGGGEDYSDGPLKKRHCTDAWCLIIFLISWGGLLAVTFVAWKTGNPWRLFSPRDFRGGFCGCDDLSSYTWAYSMMNVTEMSSQVAKQLVCSTTASNSLSTLMTPSDYAAYQCACCLTPCAKCTASLGLQDLNSPSALASGISSRMGELTDPLQASLFSPTGANAASFSPQSIWAQVTKYFVTSCVSGSCSLPSPNSTTYRSYVFSPDPDVDWKKAWDTLASNPGVDPNIRTTINTNFTFQALPISVCPYSARYCVQMPGTTAYEGPAQVCVPQLNDQITSLLGSAAAGALSGSALDSMKNASEKTFGSTFGNIIQTLDSLFVTGFWGFIVGLVFCVVLRFLIGCVIYFSLLLVVLILLGGGGMAYIRSNQCAGASFTEYGTRQVVAIGVAASAQVSTAIYGTSNISEAMTGNGADYRGVQRVTRSGRTCQYWSAQSPHAHSWTAANYPNGNLAQNFCRNPLNASSIWCVTSDADKIWELCDPIGVISLSCPEGYAVNSPESRQALKVGAGICWALSIVWVLLVFCLLSRIRLAIAVNKVAAMFVFQQPYVLMIPVIQNIFSILWGVTWIVSAAYILSQVPVAFVPGASYATWDEANGNSTTPGACTNVWPSGFAWKYEGNLNSTNDSCSGNMGNITGITPKCWRCASPRYAFDIKFCYSFFCFLWNNALAVAFGQTCIAGACAYWFFTPNAQKLKLGTHGLRQSVWFAFRYHLGSLAFGSFILAVVQFLRAIVFYLQKQAEAQKNKIAVIIAKIVQCCLWCLEKCVKFLNKNAYIQIALNGTNFCISAKRAFFLIMKNILRFGTIAAIGNIIHFIGTVVICIATMVGGYFILQAMHPNTPPAVPVVAYAVLGYTIAVLYMNVYGLAVDSSLQCFLAAEETPKGAADYVPKVMAKLISGLGAKEQKIAPE